MAREKMMSLAKKLQIKAGQKVHLANTPRDFSVDVPRTEATSADAVLVFARNKEELDKRVVPALEAAHEDRLSWIAYPKAGQLDTDLNRDILWKLLEAKGVWPVRQVALDDTWSALCYKDLGPLRAKPRTRLGVRAGTRAFPYACPVPLDPRRGGCGVVGSTVRLPPTKRSRSSSVTGSVTRRLALSLAG